MSFGAAAHADAAAGKATFNDICSECHEVADFEGEDAAELTATIKKIAAGQMKHKKALKLTDAQAADVAAFMARRQVNLRARPMQARVRVPGPFLLCIAESTLRISRCHR